MNDFGLIYAIRVVRLPIAELIEIKIQTSLTSISIVLLYRSPSSSASVFVNDLHLLHPLSVSEHTIILGDFNVNRNTTPSLYEKVVQHFKANDLQQCVTNPTTIYGSTLDLAFTGEHLPSIIYNGCYTFNSEKNSMTIKRLEDTDLKQ